MGRKKNFNKLESELNKLAFGKVIEITGLAKPDADNLFELYKNNYIVRGPYQDNPNKYILSFELNPYKMGGK